MKKLSKRHLQLLIRRARIGSSASRTRLQPGKSGSSSTPLFVEIWDGKTVEKARCLKPPSFPPSVLCFENNLNETLQFLNTLRSAIDPKVLTGKKKAKWIERPQNRVPRIRRYFDFEKITQFSTAPALVLAAGYDRAKIASGRVPPAVNFPNWSAEAFQTLYEIGFFEIIGHAPAERIKEVYTEKQDISYQVSKILSGRNADELEDASNVILELLNYLSVAPELSEHLITDINSAVSEAMVNVARHAYPDEIQLQALGLGKWWMSAKADKAENTLTIVIYDQGATIPGTLPKREWFQKTIGDVMTAIIPNFDVENRKRMIDHEFINYSMKKGNTQTGNVRRGLGLPQMQDLIDTCPDGTISIISRQGLYKYAKNVGIFKKPLATELEGTLIEWELTLPRELIDEG